MADIQSLRGGRRARGADYRAMSGALAQAVGARRLLPALAALAASVYVGLATPLPLNLADYRPDAGPSVAALATGHIDRFLSLRPAMGPVSVVVRAPAAAVAGALGAGETVTYRVGAIVCLLAVALLGAWLLSAMSARGVGALARAAVLGTLLLAPTLRQTVVWGHPEELLAGALCVAAVLAARRRHNFWAAIMLGAALATKQWALLAVLPVLAVTEEHRVRLTLLAGAVALAAYAPWLATNAHTLAQSNTTLLSAHSWISPPNVWWPLAELRSHLAFDGVTTHAVTERVLPAWLNPVPHPLVALLGLGCGLLLALRRRATLQQALSLLALVLLVRCALDPWNNAYYAAPLLLALVARDACCARFPAVSLLGATGLWMTLVRMPVPVSADGWFAAYLPFAVGLGAWLALCAFAPDRCARLSDALRRPVRAPRRRIQRGPALPSRQT
jgi:hypothetical protein